MRDLTHRFPNRNRRPLLVLALAGLTSVSSMGCFAFGSSGPTRVMVGVVLSSKTNQNSPVAVSMVAANDQKLFDKLLTMTAKQWFEQRDQLRRDDPQGATFVEWEWEYVPGQTPPPVVIEVDARAVGAVIFANYKTPGDHRYRVGPQRGLRLDLGDEDLTVSPLEMPGGR